MWRVSTNTRITSMFDRNLSPKGNITRVLRRTTSPPALLVLSIFPWAVAGLSETPLCKLIYKYMTVVGIPWVRKMLCSWDLARTRGISITCRSWKITLEPSSPQSVKPKFLNPTAACPATLRVLRLTDCAYGTIVVLTVVLIVVLRHGIRIGGSIVTLDWLGTAVSVIHVPRLKLRPVLGRQHHHVAVAPPFQSPPARLRCRTLAMHRRRNGELRMAAHIIDASVPGPLTERRGLLLTRHFVKTIVPALLQLKEGRVLQVTQHSLNALHLPINLLHQGADV
mmetsp:Transcript_49854/g.132370  ORF Transcript_49854/g.132370 Transcript_49854/m.132370 type:complete len:281 (+) Transcript_49854:431-1273(+)